LKTAKHEHAVNRRKIREQSRVQSLLTQNTNKKSDFNSDLVQALLSAKIALNKVKSFEV